MTSKTILGRPKKGIPRDHIESVTTTLPPRYGTYPDQKRRNEPELIVGEDRSIEKSAFAIENESVETTEQREVLSALKHALSDVTHDKRLPDRLTDSLLQFYRQRIKQLSRLAATNEIQRLARKGDTVAKASNKVAERRGSPKGENMERVRQDVMNSAKGKPRKSRAKTREQ
jgi:hypothetical protein